MPGAAFAEEESTMSCFSCSSIKAERSQRVTKVMNMGTSRLDEESHMVLVNRKGKPATRCARHAPDGSGATGTFLSQNTLAIVVAVVDERGFSVIHLCHGFSIGCDFCTLVVISTLASEIQNFVSVGIIRFAAFPILS